jgi:16S rRNA (adenine1518-N6/adenine1519-N6)-dimethyltransferase
MNLLSPREIKTLLQKYQTKPSRGLGQNFLIDRRVLGKIIESAEIKKDDTILEVGPGIGTLTRVLAEKAGKVIAIEKDEKMIEILKETLSDYKNVEIISADILNHQPPTTNYKVVANIPYYLTSPLIRKLLESENPPSEIVLMVQKEVSQRICSKPPDMSLLAVSVQFYAEPKIILNVPKNCFLPAPKVDSTVIKIIPQEKRDVSPDKFFAIVKAGFCQPRKQLVNNLTTLKTLNDVKLDKAKTSEWLLKNNIKPTQRPETLNVSDWIHLVKYFYEKMSS